MAKERKTVEVASIKMIINDFLLNSPDDKKSSREDMIHILESTLILSSGYHGFSYLNKNDMKNSWEGTSVGINIDEKGAPSSMPFENTDHTRVHYH